jgi:hypothetical protein
VGRRTADESNMVSAMMAVFKKDEVMDDWMHCDYHLARASSQRRRCRSDEVCREVEKLWLKARPATGIHRQV